MTQALHKKSLCRVTKVARTKGRKQLGANPTKPKPLE